ncbi:MAG: alcohol dehydrogenase catalytic domain-containing protein [Phototrophicaceae bacterium]
MQAAYYTGNKSIEMGDSSSIAPAGNEVQIRVAYGGICGTDLHIFRGAMSHRVNTPQIMGHEISGTISAIGSNVKNIAIGERVAVMPLEINNCPDEQQSADSWYVCDGIKVLGLDTNGGFQTYWTVPADTIHKLPDNLSLTHGALLEPLAVACHAVRRAKIIQGESVVVLGGGPIGTLVALVAREAGADVTISELNDFRIGLLRNELGFKVVNPLEADLKSVVMQATDGRGCDAIFEVTGNAKAASIMTELPRIHGRIMITGIFAEAPQVDLFKIFWREIQLIPTRLYNHEDFQRAIQLAASGAVNLDPVITDIRPLRDLQRSLEEIDQGANALKILIEVNTDNV